MSHEIRTPMNGIMGMTELALMEPTLPQRAREFLGLAKESAKGLLEIINDVLDLAKIESGRVELEEERFALAESLHNLLEPLRLTAERKGLRLVHRVAADVPAFVRGDEGRLRQVLTNLVWNAIKFTDAGEVEITAGLSDEGARTGRTRVLFGVRDSGIGIPAENLCTVFETFSPATRSTHARYGGTGLGLSIARQLVELMGGRIWAESEPGRGSLFRFTAEFAEGGTSGRQSGPEPVRAPVPGDRLRVLVAEDNPMNRLFAQELLRALGHEVVLAGDGEQALRALAAENFDVVLMDVQMPVLNGDEAARLVRAGVDGCSREVPIVALTAHAVAGDRERFLAAGMDDYLSKPFDSADLAAVLARVRSCRRDAEGGRSPAGAGTS